MYYLGIDGGGTKTAFVLCDNFGNIIKTYHLGTCYFTAIGERAVFNLLKEGFEHCTNGIDKNEVFTFCGMPQVGELEIVDRGLENIKNTVGFEINFCNDVTCAAAGSLMFRPGIHIIAGTGSNAVGYGVDGNIARAGGWGFEIHGDEGSAYDIAIEMLHEFTKQSDYRHPRTLLHDALREKLNLKNDFEVCKYLLDINFEREKIAKFAIFAHELYEKGDSAIKKIYDNAADELCLIACGIRKRLKFEYPVEVSYSGGVFKSGDAILKPLEKKLLENNMILSAPFAEPVIGSVLLAARVKGETNLENMKERLKSIK